ncbi:MAG: hypothetical protein R3A51_17290 [Nannocystaceae bacterium]|nr:hypothetical protein [Myxococcales bacterium]
MRDLLYSFTRPEDTPLALLAGALILSLTAVLALLRLERSPTKTTP